MDIKIKEPLYVISQGTEYVVRQGTVGVEKNRLVFFYDVTRTNAVGFAKDFCTENPQMFSITRNLTDKEISQKEVLMEIAEAVSDDELREKLFNSIKSL